ncbi:MAG TPA: hypothetical protein ENI11_04940 [Actinobacteria bacterium]|nr:hypothetical protein [Actinomycetota bacterium]
MAEPAWIDVVPDSEATGKLKEVYDKVVEDRGQNINIARAASLWPEFIDLQEKQFALFSNPETYLDHDAKDLIAALVAQINHSVYYSNIYRTSLVERGWTDEKVGHILQDIESDHVDQETRAALVFTEKITSNPKSMTSEDIEKLRLAGIDERGILEITVLASHHNSLSRLANALGVRPED